MDRDEIINALVEELKDDAVTEAGDEVANLLSQDDRFAKEVADRIVEEISDDVKTAVVDTCRDSIKDRVFELVRDAMREVV